MKYLAYITIGLMHFIHVAAIIANLICIMMVPEMTKAAFFLFLGILWAIMYSQIDNCPPIMWANKVLSKEKTK